MSRNLESTFAASLGNGQISPVFLAQITFRSQTCFVWSGVGSLVWNGNTFLGVGSLGKVGQITEGVEVKADGTTLTLSGIDPTYQGECLTDILTGAPAKIWFGNLFHGQFVGTPYLLFRGTVDQPTFSVGGETISITLALENKMVDLQRPTMRRYTSADQHLQFPDDTAFGWVEQLSDQALIFG